MPQAVQLLTQSSSTGEKVDRFQFGDVAGVPTVNDPTKLAVEAMSPPTVSVSVPVKLKMSPVITVA